MTTCHVCGKEGATIADPCCSAPDCEHGGDYAHMRCLSPGKQAEQRRWAEEDADMEAD